MLYHINFVVEQEPVERKLGEQQLASGKTMQDFVYEIPLISSLKELLSDQFLLDEVCVNVIADI